MPVYREMDPVVLFAGPAFGVPRAIPHCSTHHRLPDLFGILPSAVEPSGPVDCTHRSRQQRVLDGPCR